MNHLPLQGKHRCTQCGCEYEWHYYRRVEFHDDNDNPLKKHLYDGLDGSIYDYNDHRYKPRDDDAVLNVGMPMEVLSRYETIGFWGFNIPHKCPECKWNGDVEFIDLRQW